MGRTDHVGIPQPGTRYHHFFKFLGLLALSQRDLHGAMTSTLQSSIAQRLLGSVVNTSNVNTSNQIGPDLLSTVIGSGCGKFGKKPHARTAYETHDGRYVEEPWRMDPHQLQVSPSAVIVLATCCTYTNATTPTENGIWEN